MNNRVKKRVHLLLLSSFLVLGGFYYHVEHRLLTQSVLTSLNSRIDVVSGYVNLLKISEEAIRRSAELAFERYRDPLLLSDPSETLVHYPQWGIWGATHSQLANSELWDMRGSFSMHEQADLSRQSVLGELRAILDLNPQFEAITQDALVYRASYLSKQRFLYMLPETSLETRRFTQEHYFKAFEEPLQAERNQTRAVHLTGLYQDPIDQSIALTYVTPLYGEGEHKGVIAFDVNAMNLLEMIAVNLEVGQSYLIDELGSCLGTNGQLSSVEEVLTTFSNDLDEQWELSTDGYLYQSSLIIDSAGRDRLIFAHHIPHTELTLATVKQSALFWLILFGAYLLILLTLNRHAAAQASQRLMMIDPLTGILNRRGFESQIRSSLDRVAQKQAQYAVLLIDIDHFKQVNDTHGHDVGDKAIQAVANQLKESLRGDTELARWGGEEFIVFVPFAGEELALVIAERLRKKVSELGSQGSDKPTTVSIGVAIEHEASAIDRCIKAADKALYSAKFDGRNKVVLSDEAHSDQALGRKGSTEPF